MKLFRHTRSSQEDENGVYCNAAAAEGPTLHVAFMLLWSRDANLRHVENKGYLSLM